MKWKRYWPKPASVSKSTDALLDGRFELVTGAMDLMSGKPDYRGEELGRFSPRICSIASGISTPGILGAFSTLSLPLYFPVS